MKRHPARNRCCTSCCLGVVIFAAYGLASAFTGDEPGRIVVTRGQVESLASGFSRAWQRPPTDG